MDSQTLHHNFSFTGNKWLDRKIESNRSMYNIIRDRTPAVVRFCREQSDLYSSEYKQTLVAELELVMSKYADKTGTPVRNLWNRQGKLSRDFTLWCSSQDSELSFLALADIPTVWEWFWRLVGGRPKSGKGDRTPVPSIRLLSLALFLRCFYDAVYAWHSLWLWMQILGFEDSECSLWSSFPVQCFEDFRKRRYETRMKYLCSKVQLRLLSWLPSERWPELDVLPPFPSFLDDHDSKHFLRGSAYVWFECQSKLSVDRRLELAQAVVDLKSRQPRYPESLVLKKGKEFRSTLFKSSVFDTSNRLISQPPVRGLGNMDYGVKLAFRAEVREVLTLMKPHFRRHVALRPLGLKARYEAGPGSTGTLGVYQKAISSRLSSAARREGSRLCRLARVENVSLGRISSVNPSTSEIDHFSLGMDLPTALIEDFFERASDFNHPNTSVSSPVVDVQLPEPFKVRNITKGPVISSYFGSYLQKALHSAMQSLWNFRVTRETPQVDISKILSKVVGDRYNGFQFISGDYSAATDNLDPWVSETIGELCCDVFGLHSSWRDLFITNLTHHELDNRPQSWGQLMGSVVSFPVLCIANYCLTMVALRLRMSMGRYGLVHEHVPVHGRIFEVTRRVRNIDPLSEKVSGVVINGDDIGFQTDKLGYELWRKITSDAGLIPSPGKNFHSSEFLQLNSTMFRYTLGSTDTRFRPVAKHSLSVLSPPREVSFDEFLLSCSAWNKTFQGLDPLDRLTTIFLTVWKDYLERIPSSVVNWFFPRSLGGLGLVPTRPLVSNEGQLRAAAWLRDHPQASLQPRLSFGRVVPLTHAYHESQKLYSILEELGLIYTDWLDDHSEEFHLPSVEALVQFSGRDFDPENRQYALQYEEIGDKTFVTPAAPLNVTREESRGNSLGSLLKTLKKASSLTSRLMKIENVHLYEKLKVGHRLVPGVSFTSPSLMGQGSLGVDLRPQNPRPFHINFPLSGYSCSRGTTYMADSWTLKSHGFSILKTSPLLLTDF